MMARIHGRIVGSHPRRGRNAVVLVTLVLVVAIGWLLATAGMERIILKFNGAPAELEVADTTSKQAKGLMFRVGLCSNCGMLFDFGESHQLAFWMRNTLIPLSVAFVSEDGEVISIQDMEPKAETQHYSPKPVRFAIEMNKGWFAKHRISQGSRVDLSVYLTTREM